MKNENEESESDELELIFLGLEESIKNTLFALKSDLSKINIGRAQSDIFDLIKVDYYGSMTALPHMSVISVLDYNKVSIEPYEKSSLKSIEKALTASGLDINPQIQGNMVNVYFPQMTLERRDKLIKLAKQYGEKCKIAIREHRRTAIEDVEFLKLGKDIAYSKIKEIEALIKSAVVETENLVSLKNKNLFDMK